MHPSNDEKQECKKFTTLRNACIKRMKDKNAKNPRHLEMHASNDERQECKKSTTFY
jgi:hypothetical protein